MWDNDKRLMYFGTIEDFSSKYCSIPGSLAEGPLEKLSNVLSLDQFRFLALSLTFYLPKALHASPNSHSMPLLKVGRNTANGRIHTLGSCGFKVHENNLYFWIVNIEKYICIEENDKWVSYYEFLGIQREDKNKFLCKTPINSAGLHQKEIMTVLSMLNKYHEDPSWRHGDEKLLSPTDAASKQ